MKITNETINHLHQTGEIVKEAGNYFCTAGEKVKLQVGESFPICPISGEQTAWNHAEHEHKTGNIVEESGHYYCEAGEHQDFFQGDIFPVSPTTGMETQWKHSE